jgi:predicted AlkP superfamily phosphohydrolase/phosphomutase
VKQKIALLGLDACDPDIVRDLCKNGRLPHLNRLLQDGARATVQNPFGLFVGSTWMNFATTQRPGRHAFHCWEEIDVSSYERVLSAPEWEGLTPFWRTVSDAGRRIAVIDVPHTRAGPEINGFEMSEWGCHDRHFGLLSWPPKRTRELDAEYGLHPILGADAYTNREFAPDDYVLRAGPYRSLDEEIALAQGLLQGLAAKRRMNGALYEETRPDLFISVYGESHAVGHQQWHFHDASHPRFDAAARERMGMDPLVTVYEELDASVGDFVARVGGDTTVLVLLSHGMGPHYDGTHLLDEILTRLDATEQRKVSPALAAIWRGCSLVPGKLERRVSAFAVPFLRRAIAGARVAPVPELASTSARTGQRFFMEPNNFVYGGIRFNLAGREPHGQVEAADLPQLAKRLERDLKAIVNVVTGDPIIERLHFTDRHHARRDTDTMPDVFVEWSRTGVVETVWSPKIGLVHAPYWHWRTGDHRPDGLLLACGPGIGRGRMPDLAIEDIGVAIAARLGVDLPETEGSAVPWLQDA